MEHIAWLQTVSLSLGIVVTLSVIVGTVLAFRHPTKKDMEIKNNEYYKNFMTKESCELSHRTDEIRHQSTINIVVELREEFKDLKLGLAKIHDTMLEFMLSCSKKGQQNEHN